MDLTRSLGCNDFRATVDSLAAMSGDEAEEQSRTGRLSDYLCLGVVSRIDQRDLVVDEVIVETRSKEKRTGCCRPGWSSIT